MTRRNMLLSLLAAPLAALGLKAKPKDAYGAELQRYINAIDPAIRQRITGQ